VIITKLQVAPVELDVSSQSSSTCRASRARRVERVELCCSTSSTQPKCMGSTSRMCRVESSQVEFEPFTRNLPHIAVRVVAVHYLTTFGYQSHFVETIYRIVSVIQHRVLTVLRNYLKWSHLQVIEHTKCSADAS